MPAETKKEIELEIAHVLFLDIVAYSKLSVNEQHARIEELNEIVRSSEQFREAEAASRLGAAPKVRTTARGLSSKHSCVRLAHRLARRIWRPTNLRN